MTDRELDYLNLIQLIGLAWQDEISARERTTAALHTIGRIAWADHMVEMQDGILVGGGARV